MMDRLFTITAAEIAKCEQSLGVKPATSCVSAVEPVQQDSYAPGQHYPQSALNQVLQISDLQQHLDGYYLLL